MQCRVSLAESEYPWITLAEYPWPSDLWPIENGHPKPPGPNELLVTLAEYTWPSGLGRIRVIMAE